MTEIQLLDSWTPRPNRLESTENWYVEPFTKRTACQVPGQCGGDCDCGCPYNTMTETERLPLIESIAKIFPNEWLAFIISPAEDEEFEPLHGKLIAHSPDPDQIHDAVNTVLWNQHVYVFFNGDFAAMKASYGDNWDRGAEPAIPKSYSGPKPITFENIGASPAALPDNLVELVYSVVDQLYDTPNLNEAVRRLRLARVRAAAASNQPLMALLDSGLDQLEGPLPRINEVIWQLEEGLADLGLG